ncbi:LysR family transcriptional regulator [Streptomyces sp. L7]
MDLRHLRYFLAVAETRNFTQAAASCYVAQSALSQQIARLEKDVGAQLFSRTSRSVPADGRRGAPGTAGPPHPRRRRQRAGGSRRPVRAAARAAASWTGPDARLLRRPGRGDVRLPRPLPGHRLPCDNAPSAQMAASVLAGDLDIAVVGLDRAKSRKGSTTWCWPSTRRDAYRAGRSALADRDP